MSLSEPLDLGHGVTAALRYCECTDPECDKSRPCGIEWKHNKPNGERCEGGGFLPVGRDGPPSQWFLESVAPLTLSPSLLCMRKDCGTHGFIREGRWVPA